MAEEENLNILDKKPDPFSNNKNPWKLILASSSPRREKILKSIKLDFEIIEPSCTPEKYLKDPIDTVKHNSSAKAHFVYNHVIINNLNYKRAIVAGFDTIVYQSGRYYGKPGDKKEALFFLEMLSGKIHKVITGLTLINSATGKAVSGSQTTTVRFKKLERKLIEHYIEFENVLDKAGAYDILGTGIIFIEDIKGCFYNVAGLPVKKFIDLLGELGFTLF